LIDNLVYRDSTSVSHKAKNGEDDKAEEEACRTVCERDDHGVSTTFVVEFVVAAHCDQRPETSTESKQDLDCCVIPHLQEQVIQLSLTVGACDAT